MRDYHPPGFELPPLVKDVYERLAPLGLRLETNFQSTKRANVDYRQRPDLLPCSDLLWRILYLTPRADDLDWQFVWQRPRLVSCIVGERVLGRTPTLESWDITVWGGHNLLIMLALEGESIEEVLGRRLRAKAFEPGADVFNALAALNDSLLYWNDPALLAELGDRATELVLAGELEAMRACDVLSQVRRLVYDCRLTQPDPPEWLKRLVVAAHARCAPLVPSLFEDPKVSPEKAALARALLSALGGLASSFGGEQSVVSP